MRIRILKPFYYSKMNRNFVPGEVAILPDAEVETWLKSGLAEQDKSMDGPRETKEAPKPPPVHVDERLITFAEESKPKHKRGK